VILKYSVKEIWSIDGDIPNAENITEVEHGAIDADNAG
jgi:hypothetical protein